MICPNCGNGHQTTDRCVVAVLLGVVEDRIDRKLTTEELDRITDDVVDVDALWEDLGPWIDTFEDAALGKGAFA